MSVVGPKVALAELEADIQVLMTISLHVFRVLTPSGLSTLSSALRSKG